MTLGGRARSLAGPAIRARVPIATIAITALAWPFLRAQADIGLDPSWRLGLHMAAASGMRQGVDFVWTYGPLGFLAVPQPYVGFTTLLAIVASFAIYAGLAAAMLVAAGRILPFWAAALMTLLVARFFGSLPPFEALQALAFLLAIEAIGRGSTPSPSRRAIADAAVFGILGAAALLGKLNVGVFVLAMGGLTSLAIVTPAWKGLAAFAAAGVASGLALWLATGQALGDLVPFASGAYQTIVGYSQAMVTDRTNEQQSLYLVFAAVVGLLAWLAWQLSAPWPRRARLGLLAVGLVMGFAMWKTAFTRWYPTYVFATFAIVVFPLASPRVGRRLWLLSILLVVVTITALARPTPGAYVDLPRSLISLAAETRDAVVPSRSEPALERTRAQLQARYVLSPELLPAIVGHRVHVDPWDAALAFAYPGMTWAPLPVIQAYAVWTSPMDQLNAERLRSTSAPDRIVREFQATADPPDYVRHLLGRALRPGEMLPITVDGRFPWFEEPAATLEILCRYRQIAATDRWQVLERTDSACGAPQPISSVAAPAGTAVQVPAAPAGTFVIVRVHGLEPTLLGQVRAALWKSIEWYVQVDHSRYRLVPGTAVDGLLVAVPAAVDGSPPFAFGPAIRTIAVSAGLDKPASRAMLTYEFLSVPLGTE